MTSLQGGPGPRSGSSSRSPRRTVTGLRRLVSLTSAVAVAVSMAFVSIPAAVADSAPADPASPATPTTVTADGLPTVQIDGVVWQQTVVGNTVYVAGSFTTARPAGAAPGVNTVPRNNILAYDIRTGVLITSFAPSLNGQATAIAASPDGSRIYVGGSFTAVDGASVWRVAALDASTGRLLTNFVPKVDASVRAIVATNDTVYLGGVFTAVGTAVRSRLAAFSARDGALLDWAPVAGDGQVNGLALSPDGTKMVVGGSFTTLNGSDKPGYGLGAVDVATGASLPFPVNDIVRNGAATGSITSLASDATNVYGSGYTFGRNSTLEGIFSVKWSDFSTDWIEDCHGDTYSVHAQGDVIYQAGHSHFCGNIGGFPQENPWDFNRAIAFSKSATGRITDDPHGYTNFEGNPSPSLLNWFPSILDGKYTGQNQGPWSVTGNAQYLTYGGEFPSVNGVAQQGLVRFAVKEIAPNKRGPRVTGSLFNPTLTSTTAGTVRVRWQANWDQDNKNLTYQVRRDTVTVHTRSQESTFWERPGMTFTDTGLVPGRQYGYRIFVTDPLGNEVRSDTVTVTAAAADAPVSAYQQTIRRDGPTSAWQLDEPTGPTAFDAVGVDDLAASTGAVFGSPSTLSGAPGTAVTLSGTATGILADPTRAKRPNTFTTEAWIKTTTTTGGKIIGFGNELNTVSDDVDRHVYMDNAGRIFFGVAPKGVRRTVNSAASYNNGAWHHVVATLGADGMKLYVDGARVAARTDTTFGESYDGYWRIGGDNLASWGSKPTSSYFKGSVDEVAIYPTALDAAAVKRHYDAGVTGVVLNAPPTAAFSSSVSGLEVSVDGSGSKDEDGTIASYAWDFGGGATATGPTAKHTYAAAGTYSVRLTVTDDDGATNSTTKTVTVAPAPANVAPVAAFTAAVSGLGVAVDGSGSADSDGSVASYAWDFGGGVTATGVKAQHTFAAAGTYPVRLTVTDDKGLTHSTSKDVTVVAPVAGGVLAKDTFGRTVASGLGSAEEGGAWTLSGSASLFSVANGVGSIRMASAGAGPAAHLLSVSSSNTESSVKFGLDKIGSGGGTFMYVAGRQVGADEYRGKAWVSSTGAVTLDATRVVGGTLTTLATRSVSGLRVAAGEQLQMRLQVTGTSPTTVRAKLWKVGTTEPADWTVTATDSTPVLQAPGSVGLRMYLSGSATNAPIIASFDDFTVTTPGAAEPAPANVAPVAAFTAAVSGLGVAVDGSGSADSDGSVASYAWDFGGGVTATGVKAQHTFAAAGTYPVRLTVTDDKGLTHSTSKDVTVVAPVAGGVLAKDTFGRTVASGLGSAEEGGAWTLSGSASLFSVANGVGSIRMASAGAGPAAHLLSVSSSNTESSVKFGLDKIGSGGGTFMYVAGRQVGADEYRGKAWVSSTGAVTLDATRVVGGTLTTLATRSVSGLRVAAGEQLQMRLQVTGISPTTVRAKLWKVGTTEPADWTVTATDSTPVLQAPGSVGLRMYLSGSATNAPIIASFDDFTVTTLP
ncbi:PKD domain-containing protein [Arthrobacter agilis]|uniref:PKD domain-containing protein n=1 Tax=Arthrobacter agilis TaxID=37921 RepID=UPI002366BE0E|nr:PKD domain-containing protein [Arthrobacter agilis]WDF34269.1 PKD domain-containing protein [Arthrobacter agilis]